MIIDLQQFWGERDIFYPGILSAKIIDSMQKDGWVILRSKECRNAELNGLFDLLDQLSFYWNWDKANITLETNNFKTTHDKYTIKYINFNDALLNVDLSTIQHKSWNKEKIYGMFIGRVNVTRLHAAHKHKMFDFKDRGLTSFNQDIKHYIDQRCLLDYMCSTNTSFKEAIDIAPYSDIDNLQNIPIIATNNIVSDMWNNVYEKIGIEIVCETAEDENCFSFSEKIVRAMLYKKPFFLISSPGTINFYKNTKNINSQLSIFNPDGRLVDISSNFKFFENVIPVDYDTYGGVHRVDYVFDILHELIRTDKINTIIEDCASDVEHNYNEIIRILNSYKPQQKHYASLFNTEIDWICKPKYDR
jgi:hypothetical protein